MPSTSAPSEVDAVLYDGETATPHPARLSFEPGGLWVRRGDQAERLATAELRLGDRMPGRSVLRHAIRPGWRLTVAGELPPDWQRALVRAARPSRDRIAIWTAAGTTLIGALALLYVNGGIVLERLAPLVPRAVTVPIGQQVAAIFAQDGRCEVPAGRAALDKLVAQLRPQAGFIEPVTVQVVDSPTVNAMAVPGGQVLVFSQLIDEASGPDELAGVLAHELGHVQRRHPTQALVRHFGVSIFLSSMGGDIAAAADLALLLNHTRTAERQADAWAIERLHQARISTAGIAAFFARHAEKKAQAAKTQTERALRTMGDYMATHPPSAERMALFRAADLSAAAPRPALAADEWRALRGICGKKDGR